MHGRLAGKRILVVEDEYLIASDIKRALDEEGATVVGPAGDLDMGLSLAADEAIDAAILDVNLGAAASYPIADRLEERSVPYMFLTGYDAWAIPGAYAEAPRVLKPFPIQSVLTAAAGFFQMGAAR